MKDLDSLLMDREPEVFAVFDENKENQKLIREYLKDRIFWNVQDFSEEEITILVNLIGRNHNDIFLFWAVASQIGRPLFVGDECCHAHRDIWGAISAIDLSDFEPPELVTLH